MHTTSATYGTEHSRVIFGEKPDHLGNVRAVVSDVRKPATTAGSIDDWTWKADVRFSANYYDGVGMIMPGTLYEGDGYRFGAQGSEVEKELDGTRNWITTYYRNANLKTMRWSSPDPKVNASWSPYAMMSGNPVMYNDIYGDTVKITHRKGFLGLGSKETLTYRNGNLYNADGSEYTEKVKGFLMKTINALKYIDESTEGSSMLNELQNSTNVFTIQRHYKSRFVSKDIQKAYAIHFEEDTNLQASYDSQIESGVSFSGGTIYWNPSGEFLFEEGGGRRSRPKVDLAHEMFHGLDANRGLLDDRKNLLDLPRDEWQATYRENIFRQQMGLPLRTHYKKEHDLNTDVRSPLPPYLLTPDGNPTLPSWYTP